MKGLLIKDLCFFTELKKLVGIVLIVSIFLYIGNGDRSITFVSGYITIMVSMMAVISISYDEMNNGFSFLLTLPISRKQYVQEKYVMGILLNFLGWLYGLALLGIRIAMHASETEKFQEAFLSSLIILTMGMLFMSISIPIQLKMGGEKGRMAAVLIIMGFSGIIVLGDRFLKQYNENLRIQIYRFMEELVSGKGFYVAGLLLAMFLLLFSCFLSVRIMEKKEL